MGLTPPNLPGGIMKFADFYGEIEIDDEEWYDDDHQGHLVAAAHRIVNGESADPPTVEMLAALIGGISSVHVLLREIQSRCPEDIPF